MGFRFRKSVKLLPGVRVNFGLKGASLSLGGRGIRTNVSSKGIRNTVGIPGTGLSYSEMHSFKSPTEKPKRRSRKQSVSPPPLLEPAYQDPLHPEDALRALDAEYAARRQALEAQMAQTPLAEAPGAQQAAAHHPPAASPSEGVQLTPEFEQSTKGWAWIIFGVVALLALMSLSR